MDFKTPPIDMAGLAQSFGMPGEQISQSGRFAASLTEALERPGPALLEVMVEPGPG